MGDMPKSVCLGSKKMRNKQKKVWVCLAGASFLLVAILITLTCCVVKCQGQLKDTALDGKLTHLQKEKEALEKQRDGARAEVTELRSELAGTNQTLWDTQGNWDACRSQTHHLEKNITTLQNTIAQLEARDAERESKEQGLQAEIDRLKEQLSSQAKQLQDSQKQLQDSQQQFQKQSEQLQANIHWLNMELQSQRNQRSSGGSLKVHSVFFYLTPLALLLSRILLL